MNVVDEIAMAIDRARSLRLAGRGILGAQIKLGSSLRDVDVAHALTRCAASFKALADLFVRFNLVSRVLPCGSC